MAIKLDHIGIAQPDFKALSQVLVDLGLKAPAGIERLEKQQVEAAFTQVGEVALELIKPLSADSPVAKFLNAKGPGLHHLAFIVDDIRAEAGRLTGLGYRALSDAPTQGARGKWVQFFHPKDTAGVLIELCQKGELV